MKRLIINGDDFGMNKSCSEAIAEAFGRGLITDTTMMANGDYFIQATALAFERGFSDRIGVHFNLTEGVPLTDDIRNIPDFVNSGRLIKEFLHKPRPLTATEQAAIYRELSAQVERIENSGIGITHADSHHYIHNNGFLAPVIERVCRDHGIKKIRLRRNIGDADDYTENNRFWRDKDYLTTDYFGRMSDIGDKDIPDSLEIMVHPDFDKDGVLIDRRRVENGCPTGDILRNLSVLSDIVLQSYKDL